MLAGCQGIEKQTEMLDYSLFEPAHYSGRGQTQNTELRGRLDAIMPKVTDKPRFVRV